MAKDKYWIMSHGIVNGNPPSSSGTDASNSKHWMLGHSLYDNIEEYSSNREVLDNNYLELIDMVKDQDTSYRGSDKRLKRATGGSVDTVNTMPTWAQGAPSNNQQMSHGGRVRGEMFPSPNKSLDCDITYDWDGDTAKIRRI